jgi:hypothetical protein
MMMNNESINPNGVNEMSENVRQLSPSSGPVVSQADHGRQPMTGRAKRRKYSREDNREVMRCYFQSSPERLGYRKRLRDMWIHRGNFAVSEQRLSDQVRNIRKREWFTQVELDEIKGEVVPGAQAMTSQEAEESFSVQESGSRQESELSPIEQSDESTQLCQEDRLLIDQIKDKRARFSDQRKAIRSVRHIESKSVMKEISRINRVLPYVQINSITELNDTICASALIVTENILKNQNNWHKDREPAWKYRLQRKLRNIQKDLSKVVESQKRMKDDRLRKEMERKYNIRYKGFGKVIEELKQDLRATAQKIKRYTERVRQFCENRLFYNNQGKFYRQLNSNGNSKHDATPNKDATQAFWQEIWSAEQKHNANATWLPKVERKLSYVEKQNNINIMLEDVKNRIKTVSNWKAPGPDGVQGYWIKKFLALHDKITFYLQKCLDEGNCPEWMTTGRTVLIIKDPSKGNLPGNYRPITCLPLMWKLLTGIISDKLYEHLESQNIIGNEQMGCRRCTRGTKDHLMLDKAIMTDSKKRKTNLAMCWVDYQKAYDLVPHTWIIKALQLTGAAKNICNLLKNSMSLWNTNLEHKSKHLINVNIKRGIFQGDSLSPLLFVTSLIPLSILLRDVKHGYRFRAGRKVNHLLFMDDLKLYGKSKAEVEALVNTVRIFTDDIGMKFGLQKCAPLVMKRGVRSED